MNSNQELLAEANATSYLPKTTGDCPIEIRQTPTGRCTVINGEEIPLIDDISFGLSVVQPGSVKNDKNLSAHIGKLRISYGGDSSGDDFYDELYVIPLCIVGYNFTKFPDTYGSGLSSAPVCRSRNGLVPDADNEMITPLSDTCARVVDVNGSVRLEPVCPHAVWGPNKEKPSCRMGVRVAFMTLDGCGSMVMDLRGTSLGAFNEFKRNHRLLLAKAKFTKRDVSRYVVRITADHMGTYVKPVFSYVEAPESFGDVSQYFSVAQYLRDTLFTRRPATNETESANAAPAATGATVSASSTDEEADSFEM